MAFRKNPFFSNLQMMSPMSPRCTPSGLIMMKVSSAFAMATEGDGGMHSKHERVCELRDGETVRRCRVNRAFSFPEGLRTRRHDRYPAPIPGIIRRIICRGLTAHCPPLPFGSGLVCVVALRSVRQSYLIFCGCKLLERGLYCNVNFIVPPGRR